MYMYLCTFILKVMWIELSSYLHHFVFLSSFTFTTSVSHISPVVATEPQVVMYAVTDPVIVQNSKSTVENTNLIE